MGSGRWGFYSGCDVEVARFRLAPYGHPFMHKEHVQIKETPYGHPFMHKEHVQIKERRRQMAYYQNTIQDLYSGHYKNSYGVEGMCVTGRSDYKKIIDVSDDMKTHVLNEVKKSYYKYNGMSGGNEREDEAYARGLNEYYKTLDREDRLSAAWTLGQLSQELSKAVISGIREKIPGWQAGEQIPTEVLDEIFSGKTIESIMTRKAETGKEAKETNEDRLTLSSENGEAEPTAEERSGRVAVNEGKRARQIASAKTPAQVQIVISLLKQDVADCENGLSSGMCDEDEVKKAKALLQKAMDRLSEVSGNEEDQEEESQGSFFINMLM